MREDPYGITVVCWQLKGLGSAECITIITVGAIISMALNIFQRPTVATMYSAMKRLNKWKLLIWRKHASYKSVHGIHYTYASVAHDTNDS